MYTTQGDPLSPRAYATPVSRPPTSAKTPSADYRSAALQSLSLAAPSTSLSIKLLPCAALSTRMAVATWFIFQADCQLRTAADQRDPGSTRSAPPRYRAPD